MKMLGILFSWIAQNLQTIHKWPFYSQFWSFDKNKAPMIIFQCLTHPKICQCNFINEKFGNQKTKPTFIISVLKVKYKWP